MIQEMHIVLECAKHCMQGAQNKNMHKKNTTFVPIRKNSLRQLI